MVMDIKGGMFDFFCGVNSLWLFRGRNKSNIKKCFMLFSQGSKKKGDMELEEIVKIVFILIALVVIIGGVVFLLVGKGGDLFASIKDVFRGGRA